MIAVVTGPPGAGKTYYTVRLIEQSILAGRFVATNVRLADDWPDRIMRGHVTRFMPRKKRRLTAEWRQRLIYVESIGELSRVRLSAKGWEKKLEGRGVVVFDEAGEALDSRAWNEDKERRKADNRFMRQHRKLGWDVYLVAQEAEQIDNRTRGLAEYEVRLRNLRRFKVMGFIPLAPFNLFLAIWQWHGSGRAIMKREGFLLSKRTAGLYNTHQLVQDVGDEEAGLVWLPIEEDAQPVEEGKARSPQPVTSGPADNAPGPSLAALHPSLLAALTPPSPAIGAERQTDASQGP